MIALWLSCWACRLAQLPSIGLRDKRRGLSCLRCFGRPLGGADLADCIAVNDARRAYGELSSLKRQNAELRRQLASLESEICSNQVAANATFFRLG